MSLAEIRKEIDTVDSRIRELFISRMRLAEQVAIEKARTEDVIYKPDRERDIIERQSRGMEAGMVMEYKALVKRVMEISRKYQYGLTLKLRDCFPYSYTEKEPVIRTVGMVRSELFLVLGEKEPGGLLEELAGEQAERAQGGVRACRTYEELAQKIRAGELDAGIGVIEHIGSGVSDELNTALLANGLYIDRCEVVKDGGEKLKVVRFSRELVVRQADNRLKVVVVTPNRSGALGSLLSMIADYGVNVTEIHSIPYRVQGDDWNYKFYLELNLNLLPDESRALIFQLASETEELRILGSYRCVGDFVE